MAPLPDNNTSRVWLAYTSVGVHHELMFRLSTVSSNAEASTKAQSLAAVLATRMVGTDSTLGARFSPGGTNFSVPIAHTPTVGTAGSGFWAQDPESVQLSLTGRSFSDGRDVTWQFFNARLTTVWPADNRYNPGDEAVIDTFRINFTNWVNAAATPLEQVVTISGTIPSVNAYVNIRANAYWQNAQR